MYDGSRFIIKEGKVSNNRGGAGRYTIDVESRIKKELFILKEKEKTIILWKINYKDQSIILKGMAGKGKPASKGSRCELKLKS